MKLIAVLMLASYFASFPAQAQNEASASSPQVGARSEEIRELRAQLARISARLDALENSVANPGGSAEQPGTAGATAAGIPAPPPLTSPAPATTATAPSVSAAPAVQSASAATPPAEATHTLVPTTLAGGATLNYTFDGYYEYNFNQPPGRVNDLRAYDVLSNTFSINQAALIYELAPDLEAQRRYGLRLDLQFGQATSTLQGNPVNEPRPDIYRNIYQAYGTYVVPVGKGLTLDFGKWASSLGTEGNYTKDQSNYTRSFFFYYLPFYHMGLRAGYQVNDKLKLNYWLVNGTNQTEPTNGFKDELFGFVLTPTKNLTWTSNYYLGKEQPDNVQANHCVVPVQPGLCVSPILHPANGKLHIIDNYATWQATKKLALTGEGDYVIQRQWATAGPGESSAPSHVSGGAAYAQYQATSRTSLAARGEYLSDRNGLFSNVSQALKEVTGTYKHQVADNFDLFLEFRRDWSNVPYFPTHNFNVLADHQSTATVGLVWWYGGKQGSW